MILYFWNSQINFVHVLIYNVSARKIRSAIMLESRLQFSGALCIYCY